MSQGWSLGAPSDAHSALHNKGCRLLAWNCSDRASEFLGQKNGPKRDMRMTGFIVTESRCGAMACCSSEKPRIRIGSRLELRSLPGVPSLREIWTGAQQTGACPESHQWPKSALFGAFSRQL